MTTLLPTNELRGLEAVEEMTTRHNLPPGLRPCIASMLGRGFRKNDEPDGSEAAFQIAVELARLGLLGAASLHVLEAWNYGNRPPMQASVLRNKVRAAERKEYSIPCFSRKSSHALGDTSFCIGKDMCPFFRQHPTTMKEYDGPWALVDSGWAGRISKGAFLCYVAIQTAERYRTVKPGLAVYVSHRALAEPVNLHRNSIPAALEELKEAGLIDYIPGNPHGRGRAATEIRRILPMKEVF